MAERPESLLVLRHGRGRVGLDLGAVREVVRMLQPSPLPGAPPGIVGVINLRGETIPVLDLESRLPANASRPGIDHHLVVTNTSPVAIAIAVTHVDDLESVPAEAWREAEAFLPQGVAVKGVGRIGDELVPVIDVDALLKPGEVMTLEEVLRRYQEEKRA